MSEGKNWWRAGTGLNSSIFLAERSHSPLWGITTLLLGEEGSGRQGKKRKGRVLSGIVGRVEGLPDSGNET